jgi:hypothetical protein
VSGEKLGGHALRRTGILRNELYVGRLLWNRQRYVKDPTTGRRLARVNPEREWIVQDVPALRIIEDELWRRVQGRLAGIRESSGVQKARAKKFWLNRRAKHLLTGLTCCGSCGGPLAAIGQDYLCCSAARRLGTCAHRKGIRRGVLEGLILDALRDNLMHPDLVAEFIKEFHAEVNRQRRDAELNLALKRRELEDVRRKLGGLIEAITDGLRAPGLQSKLDELEGRKAVLETASPARRRPRRVCTPTSPKSTGTRSPTFKKRWPIRRPRPRRWRSCVASSSAWWCIPPRRGSPSSSSARSRTW